MSQETPGEGLSKRPDDMQKMLTDFTNKIFSEKYKSNNLDAPSNLTPEDIQWMKDFQIRLWRAREEREKAEKEAELKRIAEE